MPSDLFKKGISVFTKRQTNILSAALILMVTVILSQILGIVRQRLLVSVFGASDTLGVYLASSKLPDFIFQLVIAGALSSAFIPVFTDLLAKNKKEEANKMASTVLCLGLLVFSFLGSFLFIFAPIFLQILNLGSGFSPDQMILMTNLMRVILIGELIFLVGSFFSSMLQSHNHFFIPGIAAALYNLGIIIGILFLNKFIGIYSPAVGVILGSLIFMVVQLPLVREVGFKFRLNFSFKTVGISSVSRLMWPRTLSIVVFQIGTIITLSLISFIPQSGRNYVIFDYAQTLAFAPIVLFGQTIAQAAFPILSRERHNLSDFRQTFLTSFNQTLYLVLPVSAILLILRIPVVRLIYGAGQLDWQATVLTGRTLGFFTLSIFAQALSYLAYRGFYALHDTKTPLIIGSITTGIMLLLSALFVLSWEPFFDKLAYNYQDSIRLIPTGVETIALAFSITSILNIALLMFFLNRRVGGIFNKELFFLPQLKILISAFAMGFALYIPIKLLDQLVFDTTRTINLLLLTGISSIAGFSLYLFLTWFFNVKEASTFLLLFRHLGNWREILGKSQSIIETKP